MEAGWSDLKIEGTIRQKHAGERWWVMDARKKPGEIN